jgi:hypothetical protein
MLIYVRRYVHTRLKTRATRTAAGSECVCETVPYITSLGSEPVLMHLMDSAKAKSKCVAQDFVSKKMTIVASSA